MQSILSIVTAMMLLHGGAPQMVLGSTASLLISNENSIDLEIGPGDTFLEVVERIKLHFNEKISCEGEGIERGNTVPVFATIDLSLSHPGELIRIKKSNWRDYQNPVTKEEKKDLGYIIKTLGFESLISIGKNRSSLKKAGDRIDHLHPFRFLMTVFNDEELKAGIHAIYDRGGWIWSGFVEGLEGSLKDEANRQNLLPFVSDFAKRIKIEESVILPYLQQNRWEEFIKLLIDRIPREKDPNRYNM